MSTKPLALVILVGGGGRNRQKLFKIFGYSVSRTYIPPTGTPRLQSNYQNPMETLGLSDLPSTKSWLLSTKSCLDY